MILRTYKKQSKQRRKAPLTTSLKVTNKAMDDGVDIKAQKRMNIDVVCDKLPTK